MASRIQTVIPRQDAHMESVAEHCKRLQADGKSIVFVTANRPYSTLTQRFKEVGVEMDSMWWLDAVSSVNGHQPVDRPANALFLQSPTMLEMIAMRAEQLLGRAENPHLVIDCMNALALYNGAGPVAEFSHYVTNRLRARDVSGDLLVLANDEGAALEESISTYVDGREPL